MKSPAVALLLLALSSFPSRAEVERVDATVPMSDGVLLEATLYLPAGDARVPLIVRHHGGGSNKDSPFDVKYALQAVETGRFAALMYSVRGHGGSEGLFDFFGERTTQDFSEMLDWVEASHGARIDTQNVGASGYSQGGGESLLPAAHDARVKALAVGNTFADLNHALNPNDAFKFAFATGIFVGAYTATASRVDTPLAVRWGATFYGDTEDLGTTAVPSTTVDLALRSPQTYVDALIARRVPLFWTNSWEDQLFPADHPERMLAPMAAAGVPVHYWFASGGHAAGASFLAEEEQRERAMLAWFEQHLLGLDRGFSNDRQVDYWQRATGNPRQPGDWEHHTAAAWPPEDVEMIAWQPRAGGELGRAVATAAETAELLNSYASANFANDALTLEVANNVPGMGALLAGIPESENPLDTLTFTSPPLDEAFDAVGAPRVTVAQDSVRAVVQQLAAKVWDVGDDGARLIWRGAVSGPLGREVSFTLWPNAHRFEAGHRIVLMLSSVDFPTFKPDVEPWRTNVQLAGTKLELPVRPQASAPPPPASTGGGGGGMLSVALLALLMAGALGRTGFPLSRE